MPKLVREIEAYCAFWSIARSWPNARTC